MSSASARVALACGVLLLTVPSEARGETPPDWRPGEQVTTSLRGEIVPQDELSEHDGVYGRLDGDLTLTLGLGAEFHGGARGAVVARALYYHTAGLTFGYADSLGEDRPLRRIGFAAIEVRPLFLPRWALDKEFGNPLVDLTLDSLALSGGFFIGERGEPGRETRSGLEVSLGIGVPLFARAEGLWLEARGFLRPAADEGAGLLVALSLYESLLTPLVE